MSYIGHRCGCGHTDLQHTGEGTPGTCTANCGRSCGRGCTANPEPALTPTFDHNGQPVDRIIPPGDGLQSESGAVIARTCTCDDCTALYAELTNA